jgi:hypothetical protein
MIKGQVILEFNINQKTLTNEFIEEFHNVSKETYNKGFGKFITEELLQLDSIVDEIIDIAQASPNGVCEKELVLKTLYEHFETEFTKATNRYSPEAELVAKLI